MMQNRRGFLATCGFGLLSVLLTLPSTTFAETEAQALSARLLAAVPPHGDRSLGQVDAPVVIIEYASATCPHCAEFHEAVFPDIKSAYIETGKVRFILREFPLDQRALAVFMLSRCVPEDKYFATIDMVFRRQKLWNVQNGDVAKAELQKIMQLAGLSETDFNACLKREDLAKGMIESSKTAREQFGVRGTPSFFVNGKFVDGHEDVAAMRAAIDAALAQQ